MEYSGLFRQKYAAEDPWHYGSSLFEKTRHAAMVEMVLASQPQRVLDLGCGEGHFLEHLLGRAPWLRATGVELAPAAAERCRSRLAQYTVEVLTSDLLDFLVSTVANQRRGAYDVVICGDVLYYLSPEVVAQRVVPGVAALLRTGGGLVTCYADVNDHAWSTEVFKSRFRLDKQVYIKPMQDPPPWPWMVSLLTLGGS